MKKTLFLMNTNMPLQCDMSNLEILKQKQKLKKKFSLSA